MKPAAILLILGAIMLGFGSCSQRWVVANTESSSMHVGLVMGEGCYDGDCHSELNLKGISHVHGARDLMMLGASTLAFLAGLAGAVMAIISGIMGLSSGRRGPALGVVICAGMGMVLGLAFVGVGKLSPGDWGISAIMYFLGAPLALVGAILAMKAAPARPMMMQGMPGMPGVPNMGMMPPMGMQPGYMQPPQMQQPMTPPCNQCGGQTQWVAQYGKLFCGRCNRYLV